MVLSEDFSFYVQNACVTDKTLAPAGKSTPMSSFRLPNNKSRIDWDKEKQNFRNKIIEALETRGGYHGLRENIEEERMVTPTDWSVHQSVYLGGNIQSGAQRGADALLPTHNEFEESGTVILWVEERIREADSPRFMNRAESRLN